MKLRKTKAIRYSYLKGYLVGTHLVDNGSYLYYERCASIPYTKGVTHGFIDAYSLFTGAMLSELD